MAVGRQRTQAAAVAKRPDSGSAAGAGGSIDAIKANAAAAVGGTRTLGVRTRSAAQLAANSVSAAGPVKPATNAAAGTRRNVLGDVSNKGKENVALPLDGKVGKQELALKPASRNTTAAAGPAQSALTRARSFSANGDNSNANNAVANVTSKARLRLQPVAAGAAPPAASGAYNLRSRNNAAPPAAATANQTSNVNGRVIKRPVSRVKAAALNAKAAIASNANEARPSNLHSDSVVPYGSQPPSSDNINEIEMDMDEDEDYYGSDMDLDNNDNDDEGTDVDESDDMQDEDEDDDEEHVSQSSSARTQLDSQASATSTLVDSSDSAVDLPEFNIVPKMKMINQQQQPKLRGIAGVDYIPESIDEYDEDADPYDPLLMTEYADEIFNYMNELELDLLPNANYMDRQTEIEWSMRGVLVDWLIQVHSRFNMLPETLFLCVNYVDRFLSCKVVSVPKLQLVGAVALFLAAKYEEIQVPPVDEIVYMVDNAYDRDEILKAERYMFTKLSYAMGHPGPLSFVRRISKADDYDDQIRTCAKYVLEVMMMDERFIQYPASVHAAVSIYVSRKMLIDGPWTPEHAYYAGYAEVHIAEPAALVVECMRDPLTHHKCVYDKYKIERHMSVSRHVAYWMAENVADPVGILGIPVHKAQSWKNAFTK